MAEQTTVSLTPNGYGSTIYLGRDLLQDTQCPLSRGDDATARIIPNVGVLVYADGASIQEVIPGGSD